MSQYRKASQRRLVVLDDGANMGPSDECSQDANPHFSELEFIALSSVLLQLYAVNCLLHGYVSLTLAVSFSASLLSLTQSPNYYQSKVWGIDIDNILPYLGYRYPNAVWSEKHSKMINGPARDIYANFHYTIPLYLVIWYCIISLIYPPSSFILFPISVMLASRFDYWVSPRKSFDRMSSFHHLLARIIVCAEGFIMWCFWKAQVQVLVTLISLPQQWAVRVTNPSLFLAFLCVSKLHDAWGGGAEKLGPNDVFEPYDDYWEESVTEEEIAIWEQLVSQEAREGSRRPRKQQNNTSRAKEDRTYVMARPKLVPHALHREKSPEPKELFRGSQSGDEYSDDFEDGGDNSFDLSRPPTTGVPVPMARPSTPSQPRKKTAAQDFTDRVDEAVANSEPDRISRKFDEALTRNPALAQRLLQETAANNPEAVAARRKARIENFLVVQAQAKISVQHLRKPGRAKNSLGFLVPYNDNHEPAAPQYQSIIEDPLARDPAPDDVSDTDNLSDVYALENDYPVSTFPYRYWKESFLDTFGTLDVFFDRRKRTTQNVLLFLAQFLATCVLLRISLIVTGLWPLRPIHMEGDNLGVVKSSLAMLMEIRAWIYRGYVAYWGRLVRDFVELLVNDPLVSVFSVFVGFLFWMEAKL